MSLPQNCGVITCLWIALLSVAGLHAAESSEAEPSIHALLERFCSDCHGNPEYGPEGDLSLSYDFSKLTPEESGPILHKALNAVIGHEMPPSDSEQPSDQERRQFVEAIRKVLSHGAPDPGRPVMRRMTRLEYNNTVRDLLGLETDVFIISERLPFGREHFQPEQGSLRSALKVGVREYGGKYPVFLRDGSLPGDSRAENGFANRGDVQNLSSAQLDQYMKLAEEIAFHPELLYKAKRMQELFPEAKYQPPASQVVANNTPISLTNHEFGEKGRISRTAEGSSLDLESFREKLSQAFQEDRGGTFTGEDLTNLTIAGKGGLLKLAYGQNASRTLAVNPNEDLWVTSFGTVLESSGQILVTNKDKNTPKFELTFQASDGNAFTGVTAAGLVLLSRKGQSGVVTVTFKLDDDSAKAFDITLSEGAGEDNVFLCFEPAAGKLIKQIEIDGSQLDGSYVLFDDLSFITAEPPADMTIAGRETINEDDIDSALTQHKHELKLDTSLADSTVEERLTHFLQRAFRRPVSEREVAVYVDLYNDVRATGADDEKGMRTAIHAILSSPSFLFLAVPPQDHKPNVAHVRPLSDYELATRLSYFLWSSMPDDELLRLANQGKLQSTETLKAQVDRMLHDPRAVELSENFFVQWLHLQELWSAQPDRKKFREYYQGVKRTLAQDMFCELLLLVQTVVVEDQSILELLDPESSYINGKLVKLYDLKLDEIELAGSDREITTNELKDDNQWYRIHWPEQGTQSARGGILTSAGTLTMTSFPHRTSSIRRGAWFLETVFNRPPPPPNVNVAEIDDREGFEKLSLREQVELHRANAACAVCHNRIDPPGFALENFDAIGRWRNEDNAEPIDPSGEITGIGTFTTPGEFRDLIIKDRKRFVRGFTEHLLSFALARELTYADTATVERIVESSANHDYRLSYFVHSVVLSDSFRYVRTSP